MPWPKAPCESTDSSQSRAARCSSPMQTQERDSIKWTQHGQGAPRSACNPPISRLSQHSVRSCSHASELAPDDTLASLRNSSWLCQQMSASDNKTQSRTSRQRVNLGLPAPSLRCDLGASEPSHHPWHRHPEQSRVRLQPPSSCFLLA